MHDAGGDFGRVAARLDEGEGLGVGRWWRRERSWEAPERAAEAIASFEEQMAQEGRSIPLALLTGLLQPDPSLRVDAAQALQDAWLELAPDLPAAQSYATGVKKCRESTRRQRTLMQPY